MLSIIIPTLNEEEGIAKVLCSIPEAVRARAEVIVVDASSDCTPIIAARLGAKVLKSKKGKGRQMREAVKASKGEILIFLDGDGTDPPSYIPQLLEKLKGSHLVLGCRNKKDFAADDKRIRNVFKVYGFFVKRLFKLIGFKATDPLAGFRAIRRKDWDKLDLKSNDFAIETEMNIKAMKENFAVKEIAIPHLKRCGGMRSSKLIFNSKQWINIFKMFLRHFKDEKMKSIMKNWQRQLKKLAIKI